MTKQHRDSRKLFARRVVATITVVALLLGVLPLSIPANRSNNSVPNLKDQSQPFPCMNRPCGCQSADQCWKKCCCFNKAQKLAWARKNNVTPPSYLTDGIEEKSFVSLQPKKKKSCCQSKQQFSKVVTTIPEDKSLCGASQSCCKTKTTKTKNCCKKSKTKSSKPVIGFFVQKCRGYGHDFTTLPWLTLEKIPPIKLAPDLEETLGAILITQVIQSYPPALPPPKFWT